LPPWPPVSYATDNDPSGHKQTIFASGTAVGLLEAQAAVGSITDPVTGEQMSLNQAVERDLLDDELAELLRRAERAVTGFKPKGSDETLSLFQAMNRVRIGIFYLAH